MNTKRLWVFAGSASAILLLAFIISLTAKMDTSVSYALSFNVTDAQILRDRYDPFYEATCTGPNHLNRGRIFELGKHYANCMSTRRLYRKLTTSPQFTFGVQPTGVLREPKPKLRNAQVVEKYGLGVKMFWRSVANPETYQPRGDGSHTVGLMLQEENIDEFGNCTGRIYAVVAPASFRGDVIDDMIATQGLTNLRAIATINTGAARKGRLPWGWYASHKAEAYMKNARSGGRNIAGVLLASTSKGKLSLVLGDSVDAAYASGRYTRDMVAAFGTPSFGPAEPCSCVLDPGKIPAPVALP